MTYPPAPWTLQGKAWASLQLVEIERVRPFIPKELNINSVWLNQTLSCVYIAQYGAGSALEYNELIVAPAFVRYGWNWGMWISHIYVDHPDSVAGGREIWGLPKELAEFRWAENSVAVYQSNQRLCNFSFTQATFPFHFPLKGTVLSTLGSNLLSFKGEIESRLGLSETQLDIPLSSPLNRLQLGQSWLSASCESMRLVAGVPEVIGKVAIEVDR